MRRLVPGAGTKYHPASSPSGPRGPAFLILRGLAAVVDYLLLAVLLVLSAAFSGTETAFFSLHRSEVAKLVREEKRTGARVKSLLDRSHDLLSALLIGNLLVNSAASVAATGLILAHIGPRGVALAVPLITLSLLLFGEITPKVIALHKREAVVRAMHRPLGIWLAACRPLLAMVGALVDAVVEAIPWERTGSRPPDTRELQVACELAVRDGALNATEAASLARLLELGELEVVHVMTPRTEVVTLRRDMSLRQVLAVARRAGYNRYPVWDEQERKLDGLFHLKDLLGAGEPPERPLAGPLRPLHFVPESKDVAALLSEMRTGGTHLAAVVDEHGDFTGIATMADCLHALLGPVADAAGDDRQAVPLGPGRWLAPGRLEVRDLASVCGVEFPASRDYVTVAGFIMARLGRVPRPGDRVEFEGVRLTVLEMSDHRIDTVEILRAEDTGPEADREGS